MICCAAPPMTKSTGAGRAPLVPTIANSTPDGVRSIVDWARWRGFTSWAFKGTTHAATRTSPNARRTFMKFLLKEWSNVCHLKNGRCRSARARAASGDALVGRSPAGIEGVARLVEVDYERSMVGGYRLPLARLTVDLGPDHTRLQRGGYQQVVDAHAKVLMEVAGTVVPPRVPSRLGMAQPVGVEESPAAQP